MGSEGTVSRRAWQAARVAARSIGLFGLWMVLVDTTVEPEILTGVATAGITAILGEVVASSRVQRARFSAVMLRHLHRSLWLLVTDSLRVSRALTARLLLRPEPLGRFRAARYGATSAGSEDRARRILTEWGASLGANRIAIGIDCDSGYLLVHELVPSSGALDPLALG